MNYFADLWLNVLNSGLKALGVTLNSLIAGEDIENGVLGVVTKPVPSASYSGTPFVSLGTHVSIMAKNSAGNLLCLVATNQNAAVRHLQIHNKASTCASGDIPVLSIPMSAGSATSAVLVPLDRDIFGAGGKYLATGIAVAISATGSMFVPATATDHYIYGETV